MNIDKIKIPKEHDHRRKLTDEQKRKIKDLYFLEHKAIRAIARTYQKYCSRRLIQFVLFPERDEKLKKIRSQEKRHLKYYDREKHTIAIRDLRRRKKNIIINIKNNEKI